MALVQFVHIFGVGIAKSVVTRQAVIDIVLLIDNKHKISTKLYEIPVRGLGEE